MLTRTRPGVAIVGVGTAGPGEIPCSGEDYVVAATRAALDDAGLTLGDIDGLITCKDQRNGAGGDLAIGLRLGLNPDYSASLDYGTCNFSLHLAAMVIDAGLASTVLLTYGTDQGTAAREAPRPAARPDRWGLIDPIATIQALAFRRHQHQYGLTEEQVGGVAVAQRAWARLNPGALRRDPLTIDQYLSTPYLVEPARALDIRPYDDGGAAVIMSSARRADGQRRPHVELMGMSQAARLRRDQNRDNLERRWLSEVADRAFAQAGVSRAQIDLVSAQDAASMWTIHMLEGFGFVPAGQAGSYFAAGQTAPGGELPVNTSGGHLSEAYMWGWLHVVEVVRQLRGECGDRQVKDAHLAIHGSTMVDIKGSATIFGRVS